MGIDFSHCDAHWSYGGFMRFRIKVAAAIGIDLDTMAGFNGTNSWDAIKDPIVLLLDHSDCDGELTPDECAQIAPRLQEIIASWDDDELYGYDKDNAQLLIEGMLDCAISGENLRFR